MVAWYFGVFCLSQLWVPSELDARFLAAQVTLAQMVLLFLISINLFEDAGFRGNLMRFYGWWMSLVGLGMLLGVFGAQYSEIPGRSSIMQQDPNVAAVRPADCGFFTGNRSDPQWIPARESEVDSRFQPVDPKVKFGTVQPIASGTRVTEPGQAIQVVFVLEIPKLVELPQDTFLSKYQLDILAKMGILPRDATDDENITVSLRQGRSRQPIEGKAEMEDFDYKVVVNRLTQGEVEAIVKAYTAVAGKEFENLQKIATLLGEQVNKFQVANPGALALDSFHKMAPGAAWD